MHDRKVAVVVGDGQIAAQCAKLVAGHDAMVLPVIIHHEAGHQWSSQVEKAGKELHIRHLTVGNINDRDGIETLTEVSPDIVFSVNNWDVMHAEVLAIPKDGVINFHNGPLPDYRGVNVPSWAIINGEKDHGVTWHFAAEKIDAGAIVASASFELCPRETAISLTLRCIKAGVELFAPLLDRYASGRMDSWPQKGEGRYYAAKDPPPNQGYLDFTQSFDRLSRLVRGLSFRPFENLFAYPKIRAGSRTLLLSEILSHGDRDQGASWTCGEIRKIDEQGIVVCAADCLVRLSGLMEEDLGALPLAEVERRYNLAAGVVLD